VALFPMNVNVQGDFVLQLVAVDTDNTMDEVAAAAAHHSVGRRVKRQPGKILRVRKQGSEQLLPRDMKVSESGIRPMDCVEVVWETSVQGS